MAKEAPAKPTTKQSQIPKLPRLLESTPPHPLLNAPELTLSDQKIQTRPLLHPAIAPPRTSAETQKVVYISASSPFISVVKRVRKLLSHIESRATGPIQFAARNERDILRQIESGMTGPGKGKGKAPREEEVLLKATGKAIEKLLGLVVYFQEQDDVKIVVRTGSVGAVDDIVVKGEGSDGVGEEDRSQVRRTSALEVGISLR